MARRLMAGVGLVVVLGAQGAVAAWAGAAPATGASGKASASDGGNTVHVGVRGTARAPGSDGSRAPTGHRGRSTAATPTTPTVPAPPAVPPASICKETSFPTKYAAPLGPGGLAAGVWGLASCPGGTLRLSGGIVVLVATPGAPAAPTPARTPTALVQQAERSLVLPAPVIALDPADFSVVNLATWLWVTSWQPLTATASAGAVSATVVAAPQFVTWTMGDGGRVVCPGPGTPYRPELAPSQQTTTCSYTYRSSSYGQGPTTGPDAGTYTVTATVTWSVTWSATGAPGGGSLPPLETTADVPVRVEQIESVDTAA